MSIPFKCQSMPIGENLRKKYFSKGVVDKVKNKLSSLNDWLLSFAEKVCLINFVISPYHYSSYPFSKF